MFDYDFNSVVLIIELIAYSVSHHQRGVKKL